MKRITALLILSIPILLLYGCSENLKDYYYILNDLTTAKYFVYSCKEDPSRTEYWKMSSDADNKFLTTEAFNSSFEQFEFFKEEYDDEGSKLIKYIMINGDKQIETTPIERDVFMWNIKDEYSYKVSYAYNDDEISFSKRRNLIGKESVEIMGKQYDAIKFKGIYRFESKKQNDSMEYWQYSYYAKGLGFVKYVRQESNGKTKILELTDILSEQEWNDLK